MSVKPVSKNNSKSLTSDQTNFLRKTRSSSYKSSLGNLALHQPKFSWRRRQSFINKLKKPIFYESTISSICPEVWQRPPSKKRQGQINSFCTTQEQAKLIPFSQNLGTHDWIKNRRSYIINKFDSFSKNILKITGKMSRDTVAKITAKIEENLLKNYELSDRNTISSSVGISLSTTNYEFSTARDRSSCERLLQMSSSKIIPEVSWLNVALVPPDMKILASNKCPINNKSTSMDKVNCMSDKEACSEIHLSNVISASIIKEIVEGKRSVDIQKPCEEKQMPPINEVDSIFGETNALNNEDSVCDNRKKYAIEDKGIFMYNKKHPFFNNREILGINRNKFLSQYKRSHICQHNISDPDDLSFNSEKSLHFSNTTIKSRERPKSSNEYSIFNIIKLSSREKKVSFVYHKPISEMNTQFLEKSVTFAESSHSNGSIYNKEPTSANSRTLRCLSSENNSSKCLQRLESSNMKNYPIEATFISQEKSESAGNRMFDSTDNKPENKTASNVFEPFGDSAFVKKYISYTNGKPASAGEKGSQLTTNFSTSNKVTDNIYMGNHSKEFNEKPSSAGDSRRYSTNNPIRMDEKKELLVKPIISLSKSKNKPLSADINTVTPIRRHSFTVHEKSTHDGISPVSFVEKPFSAGNKV